MKITALHFYVRNRTLLFIRKHVDIDLKEEKTQSYPLTEMSIDFKI